MVFIKVTVTMTIFRFASWRATVRLLLGTQLVGLRPVRFAAGTRPNEHAVGRPYSTATQPQFCFQPSISAKSTSLLVESTRSCRRLLQLRVPGIFFYDGYGIDLLMGDMRRSSDEYSNSRFPSALPSSIPDDDGWSSREWSSNSSHPVSAAPSNVFGDLDQNWPVIYAAFFCFFLCSSHIFPARPPSVSVEIRPWDSAGWTSDDPSHVFPPAVGLIPLKLVNPSSEMFPVSIWPTRLRKWICTLAGSGSRQV
ncbi:hypothetical protein B0H13DRAFT_890315 [Mycena leptocephala]|nr:hypothetical protein B0H13DRAFT_890315 [Mycena leptocephala]